ncbi:MAG: methylase [Oscillospiraceae bacterium]|nr:methylase [Oscillospiraceae bacterium]
MTDKEQKAAAKKFAESWKGKGYEKGQSQLFWIELLTKVYGVEDISAFISFEDQVHLDHTSFIDGYIPSTKVMIEQKSLGKDLNKPIKQSDGSLCTPFQQAKRYVTDLPLSKHPRWIVTCNFAEFYVYDMERPNGEPEKIKLADLPKEYYRLSFLTKTDSEHIKKEMEVSLQAGELVGKLYNAILKQYHDPENPDSLRSLNMLCVRLVFCLYAEDAGIFGRHEMFHDYLSRFDVKDVRKALIELFRMLDTKECDRDSYDDTPVAEFPYVNGGLFADENIEIPQFNEEIVDLLLKNASEDFDWSKISPTIFGAVFESTLNPETRRSGGMHYTSIENIHKVIDPLFLDDLKAELEEIKTNDKPKIIEDRVGKFQNKLAGLKFLDPACGSGNFLTETYISLRRLENEAIKLTIDKGQLMFDTGDVIRVSIGQFYGIEINDFAVTVAKTALWIAESQMMHETEEIISKDLDFLPLKTNAYIKEGNALRIDWETVVPKSELNYIMGNPPFVGFTFMSSEQKEDIQNLFPGIKNLDFVSGWFKKASDYIKDTNIECGFVSTNSITQGETVSRLWESLDIKINFAYQSFIWNSEATLKAHVHCVIIGFAYQNRKIKKLYQSDSCKIVKNINAYLCNAPDILISSRNKPLCNVPKMIYGNKPADGGNLIIENDEYDDFISKEPEAKKYIKPLLGASEFINNKKRWCLWLVGASPAEIKKLPLILERVRRCRETRENSIAAGIRKFAAMPALFAQITQPEGKEYILVPCHSSENRKYIPFGFVSPDVIVSNAVLIIPDANLYHFGVLTSNVHMAWTRAVCGRIKSDYRYSKDIVYNNFPWCNPTPEQKALIEQTAQSILDARALYPDCSLADLYDEVTMPPELRKAHQANDRAVMKAYGFDVKTMTESSCVAELMKMYKRLADK